jgi:hypothetical protein
VSRAQRLALCHPKGAVNWWPVEARTGQGRASLSHEAPTREDDSRWTWLTG